MAIIASYPNLLPDPPTTISTPANSSKKAVKMTKKPLHQAVIAPSMMYLLYPLDGDLPGDFASSLSMIS